MGSDRVCRSCLQKTRRQTHKLYSSLETQLLGVITKLTCYAVTQMFSSLGLGFAGIGKQSVLKIFDSSSKLIEHLGEHSPPEESILADAEAFVCQLYNHGTDRIDINKERAAAFCKVKKNLDSLPPTKDALHLHIRHANFQCIIWKKAKEPRPCLSSQEENGWFYKEGRRF